MAALSVLLRWPDLTQAVNLVAGYNIVGEFGSSGVFRPIEPETIAPLEEWLGATAVLAVDALLARPPPRHHAEILKITREEQDRGFCGPFLTRLEVDDLYGPGEWRPLERFLIQQADGKCRCIDNARRTGHNAHTQLLETITTVNVDCIASFARMVCDGLQLQQPPFESCPWLSLRLGTDDLPDAYRGLPVADTQLRFSLVAIFVEGVGWRFTHLYGLAYGLSSAVLSFNRLPQLGVAVARRTCLSFCAAYFDDEASLEFIAHSDVSQLGLRLVFASMGMPPQPSKAFFPGTNRHYLGTSIHVGDFPTDGLIRFQPKFATSAKVCQHLETAITHGKLDRDTAGKLRGDLNWMFSNCAGQVGPALTAIQNSSTDELSPQILQSLRILKLIVQLAKPRDITVVGSPPPVIRVYSDASFEDNQLRLGWIIFKDGVTPSGGTCVVPEAVLQAWLPRRQQIYPGEALCGLIVPWFHRALLSGCDLLWFCDNEAAASSLIRGSSSQDDVHQIAQFAQLLLCGLSCRTWFEWIDSKSNPSDGLSRDGLSDPWTATQSWNIHEYTFPSELLPGTFLTSFLNHLDLFNSG